MVECQERWRWSVPLRSQVSSRSGALADWVAGTAARADWSSRSRLEQSVEERSVGEHPVGGPFSNREGTSGRRVVRLVQAGTLWSTTQSIGDMTGGWKVIMHEQSNQCYYWNTMTGETSWEIPIHNELALGAGTSNEGNASSAIEEKVDFNVPTFAHSDTQLAAYSNVLAADGHGDGDSIPRSMETYGSVEMGVNGEIVRAAYDVNQGLTHYSSSLVGVSCEESSALSAFGSSQQSTVLLSERMTD